MAAPYREVRDLLSDDPQEIAAAWAHVKGLWDATIERAGALPEATRQARVNGEWSLAETVRHLVFATDAWIGRMVLGEANPFHPWALAFGSFTGAAVVGLDTTAAPSFDEAVAMRASRVRRVDEVVLALTPRELARRCVPPDRPGFPERHDLGDERGELVGSVSVLHCVWTVLEEEFLHHGYAERDLAALRSA